MIWKHYLFNWNSINKKDVWYSILLENVNWRKLISSDIEEDISDNHWVKVTPTYARSRMIEITGYVLADNRAESANGIDYLDNLFVLQDEFSTLKEDVFSIVDEKDRSWDIVCKVKEPLEFIIEEGDNVDASKRKFKVTLQAPNPTFNWWLLKEVQGSESVYWWMKTMTKLWARSNWRFNVLETVSEWNVSSLPKIVLTIKDWATVRKPITIKNLTNWSLFAFDLDAVSGDVITIDSAKKSLFKNWVSKLETRMPWSVFPVIKGQTSFAVFDNDGGLYDNDFDIKIYFRNALL